MKANELRKGNKVYFEGMLLTVKEIKEHDATFFETPAAVEYPDIDPVPLSAEILEACGFVEFGACYTLSFDSIRINILTQSMEVKLSDSIWNNKHSLLHIDYLHQLQNAVHALTGFELTINAEKVKP